MSRNFTSGVGRLALIAALAVTIGSAAQAQQPSGEVVIASSQMRQQFDPTAMVAMPDYLAFDPLYDGLLNLGPQGKYPGLAKSWKISEDGKTIDFTLRENVKFHNGNPYSAEIQTEVEDYLDLRPRKLSEYIGQKQVVETLEIAILAGKKRGEPLDHILFHSPPGLGKTTLAHIIATELGVRIITSSGPAIEKGGDLISILTHLERGDVLFIDEVHTLPKVVEEFLYPAMEDFCIDFIFDKGAHARSHRYRLERFTFVGATTRAGLLSAPLRERFGILRNLDFYSIEELCKVVRRSAALLRPRKAPDSQPSLKR